MRNLIALAGTAGAAIIDWSAANAAVQTSPQWVLDETGYHCAIAGKLDAPAQGSFVIRTFAGSSEYEAFLSTGGLPLPVKKARKTVQFELAGEKFERSSHWAVDKDFKAILMKALPADLIDHFAHAAQLNVAADGKQVATYALSGTAAAAAALAKCEAAKLIEAGADPAGFEPGATRARPIGKPFDWIDLPAGFSPGARQFYAALLLDIGTDGRVAGCELIQGSRDVQPEKLCKTLVQRARYEPARNGKGQPVKTVAVYEQGATVIDMITTTTVM